MEEIEISSWLTLDAIKKEANVIETLGDLQSEHCKSVFVVIEDDYLELCYSDSISNFLRSYEDKEEFDLGLEKRKEEFGEGRFEDEMELEEEQEDEDEDFDSDDTDDDFPENSDNF